MTRQILWLDSDSTRPSHVSTLTRLEKNSDDSDSKGLWLDSWLDKYDSSTSLPAGKQDFFYFPAETARLSEVHLWLVGGELQFVD